MSAYVKLFTDYAETFDEMSDTEAGRLIKAILSYGASGEIRTLSGAERLVFGIIKRQIDRDNETAEAHREAGKMGGRPKTKENQTKPNKTKQNQTKADKEKEKDKDKEDDKEKDKREDSKRHFVAYHPPTVDEVASYCREKGYKIDAEHFVSYYESNGWKVGKNPMKDWRAACRTWARNEYSKPTQGKATAQTSYEQREYEDRKPGELPAWLKEMMEEEAAAG